MQTLNIVLSIAAEKLATSTSGGFVAKISADGTSLVYSTFLPGTPSGVRACGVRPNVAFSA
jgi:hypothetical protein